VILPMNGQCLSSIVPVVNDRLDAEEVVQNGFSSAVRTFHR
jgi:hypothetical protein